MQSTQELEVGAKEAPMPERSPEATLVADISAKSTQQSVGSRSPGCSKWFGEIRQGINAMDVDVVSVDPSESELTLA